MHRRLPTAAVALTLASLVIAPLSSGRMAFTGADCSRARQRRQCSSAVRSAAPSVQQRRQLGSAVSAAAPSARYAPSGVLLHSGVLPHSGVLLHSGVLPPSGVLLHSGVLPCPAARRWYPQPLRGWGLRACPFRAALARRHGRGPPNPVPPSRRQTASGGRGRLAVKASPPQKALCTAAAVSGAFCGSPP